MNYRLTLKSSNKKTGPIPVSTTESSSCPDCPLKNNGCYAEQQPLLGIWQETDAGQWHNKKTGKLHRAVTIDEFCANVAALPEGQLWRHNQAGDLPGKNNDIDEASMLALVEANVGRRGFTYTHKPVLGRADNAVLIAHANDEGFTVNLSANNLSHADKLADLRIGPVVTVLPAEVKGNVKIETPAGRRVVVCPATYRDDVTCADCQLCQRGERKVIVGFPAHGNSKGKASEIARSQSI